MGGLVDSFFITHLIKDILQLVLCQRTALHVSHRSQLLGHLLAVLLPDRAHLLLAQLLPHAGVVPQIGLGADDQARHARAVVVDLREPLLTDVLKGGRGGDGEADEEDVGLRVRQRAEPVVILLPSSIKEAEGVGLVADPVTRGSEKLELCNWTCVRPRCAQCARLHVHRGVLWSARERQRAFGEWE